MFLKQSRVFQKICSTRKDNQAICMKSWTIYSCCLYPDVGVAGDKFRTCLVRFNSLPDKCLSKNTDC